MQNYWLLRTHRILLDLHFKSNIGNNIRFEESYVIVGNTRVEESRIK